MRDDSISSSGLCDLGIVLGRTATGLQETAMGKLNWSQFKKPSIHLRGSQTQRTTSGQLSGHG
jgi:hypothetical protein